MSITVRGTVPESNSTSRPPTARYTVSGRDPVESTLPMANARIRRQSFFSAMDLDEEEHTLTIEVLEAPTPYTLDSFFVTPNAFNSNSEDRTEDPTDSLIPPRPTGADSGSAPPPPLSTPDPNGNSPLPSMEGSANIVAILSGLVGVLLAVIVIGVALFLIRGKRKVRNPNASFFSRSWNWRSSPRPGTPSIFPGNNID
jgi:hypothetical protein